jgi:hypothetical protein
MVGMRGNPCVNLYVEYHVLTGAPHYRCGLGYKQQMGESFCKPGEYCPIVGDKKYNVVQTLKE